MRNPKRWTGWARCAVVLGALFAAAACGREGGAGRPQQPAAPLVLGELVEMNQPMPLVWASDLDSDLVDMMYMGLTRPVWRDGRLAFLTAPESPMAIAWHYELLGPDSAAIRYRLRSGVRWSDGKPITARDVLWTYRMMKDPRVASPRQADLALTDSVVAENDTTVVFFFKRRYPDMLFNSSFQIAPEHLYGSSDPAQVRTHPALVHPENGAMVVSGPFRVKSWARGQRVTFEPNPFFSPRPKLSEIVLRKVPDATTRLAELRTGVLDVARPIAFDKAAELRARAPNVRIARQEKRFYEYLAWNPARVPAFRDREVRRALGMALDVPAMIRRLHMQEWAVPASGPYPPILRMVYDTALKPLAYDPEGAKRLLESRGWRDADGDGIREKGGRPLRFTLMTNAGNQRREDGAVMVQQALRQVGADVQVEAIEYGTAFERQLKGQYDAALLSWGVQLSPDLTGMWSPGVQFNVVGYDEPEVNRLFALAQEQPTEERAAVFWKQAAARIVRDQPYTWLYYYDQIIPVNGRVHDMRIDVYGLYQNPWQWWVSPRKGGAEGDSGTSH
jgi:peptide/nickel transport system substrate-binding protein